MKRFDRALIIENTSRKLYLIVKQMFDYNEWFWLYFYCKDHWFCIKKAVPETEDC